MAVPGEAEHVSVLAKPRRSLPRALGERIGIAVTLIPLAIVAIQGWALRWVADDAFINFRVVDQIAHGNGPVFNAGERIEVGTSTVWLAILWFGSEVLQIRVEWLAVILGIVLSLVAMGAGCLAAARLARERDEGNSVLLPLGALVFAVLPPTWEFVTSGLETGLSFAWLGLSFLALVNAYLRPGGRRVTGTAALIGIGPLVRPDFAVFTVIFLGVLLYLEGRPLRWRAIKLLAVALALPVAYELFRMGYYAALVPNTALAKEAGGSYWSQGLRYLSDAVGTYALWLPLLALAAWSAVRWREDWREGRRGRVLVAVAPAAGGLVHALFVVKVGGDFMHGRMLLPAIFAFTLPFAVVAVPSRRLGIALAAGVGLWAVVCGFGLRVPYDDGRLLRGQVIVDERAYYVGQAGGIENPVTREDYSGFEWEQQGERARQRAARGERTVTFDASNSDLPAIPPDAPARPDLPVHMVVASYNIGLLGYAAGPDVWVVDRLGLGDPIAARIRLDQRGRVGHEKAMPPEWVLARFSSAPFPGDVGIAAARRSLHCSVWWWDGAGVRREDPLREIVAGVSEPLTAGRFLSNLKLATTSGALRFPRDPPFAQAQLCGPFR